MTAGPGRRCAAKRESKLEELLRQFAPTMIFVEHDRAFQEAAATKVIPLDGPQG